MTGDEDRIGVGLAGLPNGARDRPGLGRQCAVGQGFAEGDGRNADPELFSFGAVEGSQWHVKRFTGACKPIPQLLHRGPKHRVAACDMAGWSCLADPNAEQDRIIRTQRDDPDGAFKSGSCGDADHGPHMRRNGAVLKAVNASPVGG